MAVIKVPKTPKKAFNPNRRASELLKSQIEHLEWAIRPAAERKTLKVKPVKTERDAAERIEALTRTLHPAGAEAAGPAPADYSRRPRPSARSRARKKKQPARTGARAKRRS